LRLPGAETLDALWDMLAAGRSMIRKLPDDRRSAGYRNDETYWGAFLEDADAFDPEFFGISPREAASMDPQQRFGLELAWNALEDAGIRPSALAKSDTGVFMGVCHWDYLEMLARADIPVEAHRATGVAPSIVSNRISFQLDLRGPSVTNDSACSSALVAIEQAAKALRGGQCGAALAGGVNLIWSPDHFRVFSKNGMLSKTGSSRAFDAKANGYVRGEGGAIFVLKTLAQAERDGDAIHAVIRDVQSNHGGHSAGLTVTNAEAQSDLIASVMRRAGVHPDTLDYVEAHGTGTPLGDPIEIRGLKGALAELYAEHGDEPVLGRTAVGSVKTNIGHLEGAAGIAGVLKVVAALQAEAIPANAGFSAPNPLLKLADAPLRIAANQEPWRGKAAGAPRRAGVSSFGFGGTNAHALIEAAPQPIAVPKAPKKALDIPLSARTQADLQARAADLLAFLKRRPGADLRAVAHTLQTAREDMTCRLVIRAKSTKALRKALRAYVKGKAHPGLFTVDAPGEKTRIKVWLDGGAPDWRSAGTRARVHLPVYRFDRQPHWFESRSYIALTRDGDAVRCHVPASHPILADHVIDGRRVLPGTATLCLVCAAAQVSGKMVRRPTVMTKVRWLRPALDGGGGVKLAFEFAPLADGVSVTARDQDAQEVFRAILPDEAAGLVVQPPTWKEATQPSKPLYDDLVAAGIAHGPAFQVVAGWQRRDGEVTGTLDPIPAVFLDGEFVHPIHLDAAIQVASQLSAAPGIPLAADRIVFASTPVDGRLRCAARPSSGSGMDVELYCNETPVAQISGLATRALARADTPVDPCLIAHAKEGRDWVQSSHPAPVELQDALRHVQPKTIAIFAIGGSAFERRDIPAPLVQTGVQGCAWAVFEAARDLLKPETRMLVLLIPGAHAALRQVLHPMVNALVLERPACRLVHLGADLRPLEPPVYALADLPPGRATAVVSGGVFWVLGGTGGIGLILAQHLKDLGARAVILSGRTARDVTGFEVLACDGGSEAEIRDVWAQIRAKFGQVDGVIHAAGVVEDGLARSKARESFDQVFDAKVKTMANLSELLRDEKLAFLVTLGSVAGIHGALGQADYAAANARLDQMAAALDREVAFPVTSLDFSLWAEGGMQVSDRVARAMTERMGTTPIPTQAALQVFDTAICGALPADVVVGYGDAAKFTRFLNTPSLGSEPGAPQPQATPVQTGSVDRDAVLAKLSQMLAETLFMDVSRITASANFDTYGFDSLLAVEMVEKIEAWTGEAVSATLFFEALDLNGVVDKLIADMPEVLARLTDSNAPTPLETPATAAPTIRSNRSDAPKRDIAIIGMGGRYPGAPNLAQFWENLKVGRHDFTPIPTDRWPHEQIYFPERNVEGKSTIQTGGFLDDIEMFDPKYFGISQADAECMSPEVRLLLECAVETFENAGYGREALTDQMQGDVGVLVGTMSNHYNLYGVQNLLTRGARASGSYTGTLPNMISYFYRLTGPSIFVDTMCSQSLTAVDLGVRLLREGQCRMVLAGGVNLLLHPLNLISSSQEHFTSNRAEVIRSFGLGADGTILGEGAGLVLLKPLEDAERDGDTIHAVIKGTAMANAGPRNGFTVPSPAMQTKAVTDALSDAGLEPRDISYIENHGSGTKLGDPIEIAALKAVFGANGAVQIGSVKSNIAHLLAAAGIAGLTKLVLQLKHRQIAPSLHSDALNPAIPFADTPFIVNQSLTEWRSDGPRRGGLTSIGAGGMNNHMIVEEHAAEHRPHIGDGPRVMVFSAGSLPRLRAVLERMLDWLAANPSADPDQVAYTLQVGRTALRSRAAVVTDDLAALGAQITDYLESRPNAFQVCPDILAQQNPAQAGTEPATLAEAWSNGQDIRWRDLWGERPPQRIELPTYPFERVRCWYQVYDDAPSVLHPLAFRDRLHPLLGRNASDLSGVAFETKLRFDDLLDYVTLQEGAQSLTPWLVLDAAFAALDLAGRRTERLCDIKLDASALKDGAEITVSTTDGQTLQADSGEGRWFKAAAVERVDLAAAPEVSAGLTWTQDEISEALEATGRHRGPYAQGLARFGFQNGQFKAEIYHCDHRQDHDAKNTRLAPAVLVALDDLCRVAAKAPGAKGWHLAQVSRVAAMQLSDRSLETARFAGRIQPVGGAFQIDVTLLDREGVSVGEFTGVTLVGATHTAQPEVQPSARTAARASKDDTVRGIVADLLSFSVDEIDPYTRFHDMGFDSISLASLTDRLNSAFGTKLTPALFYDVVNIQQLLPQLPDPTAPAVPLAPHSADADAGPAKVRDAGVAILGMAARVPGADTLDAFWDLIANQKSGLGPLPRRRYTAGYAAQMDAAGLPPQGGYLSDIARFDADLFQISPLEAEVMDPQQRLVLEAVWHALEDAALRPDALPSNTAVFVGASSLDYANLMRAEGAPVTGYAATGNSLAMLSNRVSHLLDLHGPSQTVDTACSSSLVAVHRAVRALRAGECDLAIVAGVNLTLGLEGFAGPLDAGMLSPRGRCSTFSANADGYVRGEGVAAVVLRRVADAQIAGDPVHAVIVNSAENHGGRSASLTAPRTQAQADLIAQALGGCEPSKLAMIEAHGTGTPLGDPVEIDALNKALPDGHIAVSSVKANIGHLEAAAGLAGLIKVVLAMRAGAVPPHLSDGDPNPYLNLSDGPLFFPATGTAWPQDKPLAGVSSFGFGGVNAHVVLERATPVATDQGQTKPRLIVLSAQSRTALCQMAANLSAHLRANTLDLGELAETLLIGRQPLRERVAFVAETQTEVSAALAKIAAGDLSGVWSASLPGVSAVPQPEARKTPVDSTSLAAAAEHWCEGKDIILARDATRQRLHLPVYPFEGAAHWFSASAPALSSAPSEPSSSEAPSPALTTKVLDDLIGNRLDLSEVADALEQSWKERLQ
jgi:polyketide synthase PksL